MLKLQDLIFQQDDAPVYKLKPVDFFQIKRAEVNWMGTGWEGGTGFRFFASKWKRSKMDKNYLLGVHLS